MLPFKKFKTYVEFLESYEKKLEHADNALKKISKEFTGVYGIASPIREKYVYMLTDAMELTVCDPNLLWWWMYERDFGKAIARAVWNGKTYYLDTIKELYDFIVKSVNSFKSKEGEKKNAS